MIKPADVFIGLRDIFGFLIPGMMFCVVVLIFVPEIRFLSDRIRATELELVCLLSLSYCLGHVFNAVGSLVVDFAYEQARPALARTKRMQNLEKFGLATDPLKARLLQHGLGSVDLSNSFSRISFWTDYLRLTSPIAAAEIERVESIEKFLRSLSVAAVVAAPLVARPWQDDASLAVLACGLLAATIILGLFFKFRLERCYRVLKFAVLTTQIAVDADCVDPAEDAR